MHYKHTHFNVYIFNLSLNKISLMYILNPMIFQKKTEIVSDRCWLDIEALIILLFSSFLAPLELRPPNSFNELWRHEVLVNRVRSQFVATYRIQRENARRYSQRAATSFIARNLSAMRARAQLLIPGIRPFVHCTGQLRFTARIT